MTADYSEHATAVLKCMSAVFPPSPGPQSKQPCAAHFHHFHQSSSSDLPEIIPEVKMGVHW